MTGTANWVHQSNLESQSDADLMAALQAMNSDALEGLVSRYGGMIKRVAAGILRDDAEAEDVAQDVFLEIYRKAHLYDPRRGTVRVWLMQYAYHRSLRRKAALRLRAAYGGEPLSVAESLARGHDTRLTTDECRWMLRAGLAQLPERQRLTLELACLEELSLREIAQRLCISLGCARHYYYRGLARLKAWAAGSERAPEHEGREVSARGPRKRRRQLSAIDSSAGASRACETVERVSSQGRRQE